MTVSLAGRVMHHHIVVINRSTDAKKKAVHQY